MFGADPEHQGDGNPIDNHTEFMMWGSTYAINTFKNRVQQTQWNEWNNTMKSFNENWYAQIARTRTPLGYMTTNWIMILTAAESERKKICGSCVNDTTILNVIQQYNYSIGVGGYPQGAELSSNYNTVVFTVARMIQESGYNNNTLNASIEKQCPSILNASLQDGQVMSYYRSAGHTASFAQNIYNLMRETENRNQAYRFADLQYQKIAAFPDLTNSGYYPQFNFYNTTLKIGFLSYTRKHLQDTVTGMFMARAAVAYDNSIVEGARQYFTYHDLIDNEVVGDPLYNSSGCALLITLLIEI